MENRVTFQRRIIILAAITAMVLWGGAGFAQAPGGPPPGPGFGPGGPGRGFRRGPRPLSLADVPAAALQSGLKLSADQKDRIAHIQDQFRQAAQELMPPPPDQGGSPPDPQTMRDTMEKLRGLHQQAEKDITAVLTSDQKKAVPAVMHEIQTLRAAGIPVELLGDLKLSADQKNQIASIVQQAQKDLRQKMEAARQQGDPEAMRDIMQQFRQQTHEKAIAVLTDDQKALVEKFLAEHPRPPFGGGFGPPPGAPGDGPPPGGPEGDPDGPPPPAPPTF